MAKGGSFELEMAKRLSLWLSKGYDDDLLRRNRRGGMGDLTYRKPKGKLLIDCWNMECKTGYSQKAKATEKRKKKITNWCLLDPIDSNQASYVLIDFWEQCLKDADKTNRVPVLIFRRPYMRPCICFEPALYRKIFDYYGSVYGTGQYIEANVAGYTLMIMGLEDFLVWVPDPTPILAPRLLMRQGTAEL